MGSEIDNYAVRSANDDCALARRPGDLNCVCAIAQLLIARQRTSMLE